MIITMTTMVMIRHYVKYVNHDCMCRHTLITIRLCVLGAVFVLRERPCKISYFAWCVPCILWVEWIFFWMILQFEWFCTQRVRVNIVGSEKYTFLFEMDSNMLSTRKYRIPFFLSRRLTFWFEQIKTNWKITRFKVWKLIKNYLNPTENQRFCVKMLIIKVKTNFKIRSSFKFWKKKIYPNQVLKIHMLSFKKKKIYKLYRTCTQWNTNTFENHNKMVFQYSLIR